MKKGELFETVIRIVQESLKTSESTTVRQNYKLIDNCDLKREFDIFIESQVSNFKVNIAIECKDYKKKVEVDKIEAFHSKCNDVPQIHKRIFISRIGFQKGATIKAQFYGIDLLKLENINEFEVKNWFKMGIPEITDFKREINGLKIEFVGIPFNIDKAKILHIEINNETTILTDFIKEKVIKMIPLNKDIFRNKSYVNFEILEGPITLDLPNAFIKMGNNKSEISHISFNIINKYEIVKNKVSFDNLVDLETNKLLTQSISLLTEDKEIFSFVKKEGKEKIDILHKAGTSDKLTNIGNLEFNIKK